MISSLNSKPCSLILIDKTPSLYNMIQHKSTVTKLGDKMQPMSNPTQPKEMIRIPVSVSPRLPGGDVHRIEANYEGMHIFTWQGVYGNKESKNVISIPFSNVIDISCFNSWMLPVITCHVRYMDSSDKENLLKFRVYDQVSRKGRLDGQQRENIYTETAAQALEDLKQAKATSFPTLTFEPPSATNKLLYAGTIIGVMVLLATFMAGANLESFEFLFQLLGSLMSVASLTALGIDYIRIHTGWHPVVKFFVYVALTLTAFVLFTVLAMILF